MSETLAASPGSASGTPYSLGTAPLSRMLGRSVLQSIQDGYAALGEVTACICTASGQFLTQPTWGSRFSRLIATAPRGRLAFEECIRACCHDPRAEVPSICHDRMTVYAAPIHCGAERVGVIVVGTRPMTPIPDAQLDMLARLYELDRTELGAAADELAPWSADGYEATYRFASVLADVIGTMYAQARRIEGQVRDLEAVHGLAEVLAGAGEVQALLDLTVRRVTEAMGVKAAAIRLLDEETGELVIRAVHNLSPEYLQKGPVTLEGNYIDSAAFAGHAVYIADAPNDPRLRYPENARREGIVSGLCVPMTYRGKTVGVLRVYTGVPHTFTDTEESLLTSMGSLAASAIINSRLYNERAAAQLIHMQLAAAADVQRNMLPAEAPAHAALEFGCLHDPTLEVSGDFYDFIQLHGGYLGVVIADVVGKGIPAALRMASVRASLRAFANVGYDLHTVVGMVNRHLCRDTLSREFVTMFYGVFSPDGRIFNYCNAGHVPTLLLRGDDIIELNTGGLVIGIRAKEVYDEEPMVIRSGDTLVMITDGVTEALGFSREMYGRERLLASIRRHRDLPAQSLAQQILWDVRRFVGLADQSDDITVVVIKAKSGS